VWRLDAVHYAGHGHRFAGEQACELVAGDYDLDPPPVRLVHGQACDEHAGRVGLERE
jgi:hypothetical protein